MIAEVIKKRLRKAMYVPVLALAMVMMLGRLLLYARILDVNSFSQLSAILVVSGIVGMLSSFGFFLDLQRKLPGFLALGQRRSAATIMWQSLIGALTIAILGLITGLSGLSLGSISPTTILLGVFHGTAQQIFLIQTTESRSANDPLRFSFQSLARSSLILVFAVPTSIQFKTASAIIIPESLVAIGLSILIASKTASRLSVTHQEAALLAVRSLRKIDWRSTVALLFLSIATTASTSVDRWASSVTLQPAEFAEYSFAAIVLTAASSLQQLINAAIFPMIATRSTLRGMRSAYRLSLSTSFGMLAAFLVAIGPAVYVFKTVIINLYPDYVSAIPIIAILSVAAAFRVSDFWSSFLVINGRERESLIINTLVVLIMTTIWWFTRLGTESAALGIAYLAAFIAASTYMISFILACYHYRFEND